MPELILVAAMARNGVIGNQGTMPWHLPADLKHFKEVTVGHPVLMGRKTFEAIGRPLPGRLNIVISRSRPHVPDGVILAESLEVGLEACASADQIMVIGGGEIYRQALDLATRLELTLIDAELEGDTHFPRFPLKTWQLEEMSVRPPDSLNAFRLAFCRFRRR